MISHGLNLHLYFFLLWVYISRRALIPLNGAVVRTRNPPDARPMLMRKKRALMMARAATIRSSPAMMGRPRRARRWKKRRRLYVAQLPSLPPRLPVAFATSCPMLSFCHPTHLTFSRPLHQLKLHLVRVGITCDAIVNLFLYMLYSSQYDACWRPL